MKRIIKAIVACLIIVSVFASCNDPLTSSKSDTKSSNSSASSEESAKKAKSTAKKTYEDSFDDLEEYMKDKGYLTDDIIKDADKKDEKTGKTRMELPDNVKGVDYKYGYEFIGATFGKKYYNNNVVIELYEFKEGEKNDTIESVKKDGTFKLYDAVGPAYLTDNDKYMLVYTDRNIKDGDTESDAYKVMQRAIKDFKAFSPTKDTKTEKTEKETKETKATEETTKKS